ncbi:MAG TPA: tetratricopeptide repeat protein [Candidatus Kapabacteria bacterium]|nr:tetratricopeptide repeat protein [Candidatus Kapabacteria bacterium]
MNALTQRERFHLEAAEGWLMLGNPIEAHEELEGIPGDASCHPAVLSMRWQIYAAANWWEAAFVVSKALCELAPQSSEAWICHANTLRNYKGLVEAWNMLLGVVNKFPDDAIIRYNLACYAAQMGLLEESCAWLVQAFELEEAAQLKLAAIYDPDLRPLWEKIGRDRIFEVTGHMHELALK